MGSFLATPVYLLLLTLLPHLVFSDTDDGTAAGVFVYPTDAGSDFIFALNAVDNGDLYFHMSGPSKYSWVSVGIGEDMDDNLMFIVHEGENEDSVTLSPRVASNGESEPTFYPAIYCELMDREGSKRKRDDSNAADSMSVDAVCHNATSWDGGSLDLSSSSQEFMFAFGPDHHLRTNSLAAPLLRHQLYGNFVMDMTRASSTGEGAVPQANGPGGSYIGANTSDAEGVNSDGDNSSIIHGIVMCIAYILLYPLGALLLRLSKRIPVRLHWICQSVASVLVLAGLGLGIAASKQYNRSRDYDDPHQVIGIVLLVAVVVQVVLGAVHHFLYKKKGKTTSLGKVHLVVGPLIILLAMVNGGLGLDLACEYLVFWRWTIGC